MVFVSTLLMFIGALTATLSVEIVRKQEEHLISLRDYDFVGEDKCLSGALAARLAELRAPLAPPDPRPPRAPPLSPPRAPPRAPPSATRPDLLPLDLHRYPRVNVSLDYGELFLAPDLSFDANSSWLPGGQPVSPRASNLTANLTASRRAPEYWDPSYHQYNLKILDIMRQNVYTVQGKLIEIEPVVQRYQSDPRFRIAYIYSRLDEWKRDLRIMYWALKKNRDRATVLRFKRRIFYYEHALRRNIDITYSIEYLLHLHTEYMKKMEEIIPSERREEMRQLQKHRDQMQKMQSGYKG